MNELREIFDSDFDVILEKSELPKYALGKLRYNFVKGDKKNLNHRTYGEDILIREITKKKLELESSKTLGQLDHPLDGHTKLQDSMHILGDISYDKDLKVGVAESYILDTRSGRDFLTLLETGISLGPSMRGWGNTDSRGQVLNDWKLETIDFVLKPSFGQDVVIDKTNLIESANDKFTPEKKGENEMQIKNKQGLMKKMYHQNVNSGHFQGGFEDWKTKNEKFVDIALAEVNENLSYPAAVKKVLGESEGQKILNKEAQIQEKVTISDVYFESRIAGVDPKIYAEKLNKEIDRQNEAVLDSDEAKAILREASSAGMNISDPAVRKNILENFEKQKNEPVKTLTKAQKAELKIEEESQKNSYLVGEKIAAGYGRK